MVDEQLGEPDRVGETALRQRQLFKRHFARGNLPAAVYTIREAFATSCTNAVFRPG